MVLNGSALPAQHATEAFMDFFPLLFSLGERDQRAEA